VPRAGDPYTERSFTRRHFSGGGHVQREGARGQLCADFFLRQHKQQNNNKHSTKNKREASPGVQRTLGSAPEKRPGAGRYVFEAFCEL